MIIVLWNPDLDFPPEKLRAFQQGAFLDIRKAFQIEEAAQLFSEFEQIMKSFIEDRYDGLSTGTRNFNLLLLLEKKIGLSGKTEGQLKEVLRESWILELLKTSYN